MGRKFQSITTLNFQTCAWAWVVLSANSGQTARHICTVTHSRSKALKAPFPARHTQSDKIHA